MTTRTWQGGSGAWTDPNQWVGAVAPQPDDTAVAATGTLMLDALALAGGTLDLTTSFGKPPPVVVLNGGTFGKGVSLDAGGFAGSVTLDANGIVAFGGTLTAGAASGTFSISVAASGGTPGAFVLLGGSMLNTGLGETVETDGTILSHGSISVGATSTLDNSGVIVLVGSTLQVAGSSVLDGSGTVEVGLGGLLVYQAGTVSSDTMVQFTDVGGEIQIAEPAQFTGAITGFQRGDVIDLAGITANAVLYDPGTGQAMVQNKGVTVATLSIQGPATIALAAISDGAGGTFVEAAGTTPRPGYLLASADRAMQSDTARELTTAGGPQISGAGVKIGIISTSFDARPGVGAADVANAAALAGYLPVDAATGTAAVTVLMEGNTADDNEGLAMAELVHQVAPGAQLYFASGDNGLADYASAVASLQQAGCQVIVDDVTYNGEPFFQSAGPLDQAIGTAIASGVSYFAAAGNDGNAAYQAVYLPQSETLPDGSVATAERFANGAAAQTLTLFGGVTVNLLLQWAAPWTSTGAEPQLTATLYNAAGQAVATSAAASDGTGAHPEQIVSLTPGYTAQYQLVIRGSVAAGTLFKYVLVGGENGGATLAGDIDAPASDAGTLKGHEIIAGVNSVGAIDFSATPVFGSPVTDTAYYSATGASQLLFDASGTALAIPETVAGPTLVAPVSAGTSVAGFTPFNGTSAAAPDAAAVAALMLQADPRLTPAQVTAILQASATPLGLPASEQGAGLINADAAVRMALADAAACYRAGTRIATGRGPVAVEALRVGDLVRTAAGALRPVVWLGHRRIDCRRHPRPATVWPVRVQAGAMAPGQPRRDLFLSPDHAVLCRGALMPIRYLVNGASIAPVPVAKVEYWHVELASHDVLLAEGLPCESYLDTGNRAAFAGGGAALLLHPGFARAVWDARACARLLLDGPELAATQGLLHARALTLGHAITRDPALHVRRRGERLVMTVLERRLHVHLPRGCGVVRLRSRSWAPCEHGEPDARRLGVAVAALALDGEPVALNDRRLGDGWHDAEPEWRWTDGDAALATGGARAVSFAVALTGRYWMAAPVADPHTAAVPSRRVMR